MKLDDELRNALLDDGKTFNHGYLRRSMSQSDVETVSSISSLETVQFIGGDFDSYAPLAKLPNLKRLFINHWSREDLTSVGQITQLRELFLSENEQYREIEFVKNLINLEVLDLTDGQFSDVNPVKDLPRLRVLNLMNCDLVDNISALSSVSTLEELNLNSSGVEDLSPLSNLNNLRLLDVRGAEIYDYDPIEHLNLGEGFVC